MTEYDFLVLSPSFVDVVEYTEVFSKKDMKNDEVSLSYHVIEDKKDN